MAQIVQVVALIISFNTLLDRALMPFMLAQSQMQTQTQTALAQINAKLDELSRLSGSVQRLDKDVDAVLRKELK